MFNMSWIDSSVSVPSRSDWVERFVKKSEQIEKEIDDMPDSALFVGYEWLYKDYSL